MITVEPTTQVVPVDEVDPGALRTPPNVRLPETVGQLARITAMIGAKDTGVSGADAHTILMVPTTRREIGVVQRAVDAVDPLTIDRMVLRNITLNLVSRVRLRGSADLPAIQRTVQEYSDGIELLDLARHWLPTHDSSSVHADDERSLRKLVRKRNGLVAQSWPNDNNAIPGSGPSDEPILVPMIAREVAVLAVSTVPEPGPDTLKLFFSDWTMRAQAVTSTDPEHLQQLVDTHATGAAWAAQGWSNREMVDATA